MIEIQKISDEKLLFEVKETVGEETRATQKVLEYLSEIERRKLYLARGYGSLFEFCVKELKYSEGSAGRRISSMRLINQVPVAFEMLKENKINLSTMSLLQGAIRREEKRVGEKLKLDFKLNLINAIESKSQDDCERTLLKIFPESLQAKECEKTLSDELTEIKFIASKELMRKLKKLKGLLAHKNSNPSHAELLEMLADLALKKLDPVRGGVSGALTPNSAAELPTGKRQNSRYINKDLRNKVWNKSENRCQFIDRLTARKCGSTYALQIDHIQPIYFGGKTIEENLRLLCRNHNTWLGKKILEM